MKIEQSDCLISGYEHQVAMGYLRDDLVAKINGEMSFLELERLIGRWEEQNEIYQGCLFNPDFTLIARNIRDDAEHSDDDYLSLYEVQNWTPVCHPDNLAVDEENLKRIEELTPIKSSKKQLGASLRNIPHYPKEPTSRYIIVSVKTKIFMGFYMMDTEKLDANKVVFAQADLQTAADIKMNTDEPQINFMAGLLYDGENIKINRINIVPNESKHQEVGFNVWVSEGEFYTSDDEYEEQHKPVGFDMWIYDTQTDKKVFIGNFMDDVAFSDSVGVASHKPHTFADRVYEEERRMTNPRRIRSRKKLSI